MEILYLPEKDFNNMSDFSVGLPIMFAHTHDARQSKASHLFLFGWEVLHSIFLFVFFLHTSLPF